MLLRSWIREAGLAGSAAWVSVRDEERDLQRFWVSVLDALRGTDAGSTLMRGYTAAPVLDGEAIVERVLEDLASLEVPLWLVIDDLHELRSTHAQRQLELLLMRAPTDLRFVLSSRHNVGLGLHRLRLEAELTEFRAADLRFTVDEARALFEAAGLRLSEPALALLVDRTEGWAAGLRLAALSLAGNPDPEQLADEFSGSERTVAQYLLAEVLDRQPDEVRRLLLRTSVLGRVSGPLADVLTGASGGERILQELEEANAFVVAMDSSRSWFRYHHLFADLLQLELRRAVPDGVATLHGVAAEWFAEQGFALEAIRHAQAAGKWALAARLLSDHWFGLYLDGQSATAHELLAGFPAGAVAADAELTVLMAADTSSRGALHEADRYFALAARGSDSVPADRRRRLQVMLAVVRLQLARQRGDLPAVAQEAERLLIAADAPETAQLDVGEDLRALALINLGIAEVWSVHIDEAERYLDHGVALAHRIDRPYLELAGLAHGALVAVYRSSALAAQRAMQAVELADRHGWGEEPVTGVAYEMLGGALLGQGRLEDADWWLERADRALRAELEPEATVTLNQFRGMLELASGRYHEALRAFRRVAQLAALVVTPFPAVMRIHPLQALAKSGDVEGAEEALAEISDSDRDSGAVAAGVAVLRLAQGDASAATLALAPVVDGSAAVPTPFYEVEVLVLEAIARDALGDAGAATRALERALDLAEADSLVLPFLLHPVPELLARHRRHRTSHAGLLSEILDLLAVSQPSRRGEPERLPEALTESEIRVLRYLPTNLSQPEIAGELGLSLNTVSTHVRHLYAKLGAHRRGEAVERARRLGLLAPSSRTR